MHQNQGTAKTEAVIYCRVSTEEQVSNDSLRHQETECRRYCASHHLSVREVFREEGASAKTGDRPELKRMLTYCERHRNDVAAVVVYRFDRWARNAEDHLAIKGVLKRRRIKLLSATEAVAETPEGRMMETMLAAQAQYENDVKSEGTSRRMKEVLQRGRWPFQCPLGYLQRGREIVIDRDRGALITDAFELFSTGAFGKREVLRRVTRKGLRTRRNKRLGGQMFGRMLSNPFYAGWIVVPRWEIRQSGTFAPLVSQETFDPVQDVLSGRGVAKRTHRRFRPDFPLRHFLKCSRCGTPLTASLCTSKSGRRYPKYFCRKSDCRGTFAGPTVEGQFRALLRSLSPEPSTLRIMLAATERAWRGKHDEDRQRQGTLNARREQLAEQQRRLVAARFYDSAIDQRTFDTENRRLDAELESVDSGLSDATSHVGDMAALLRFVGTVVGNAEEWWAKSEPQERAVLQDVFFPSGVPYGPEGFGTSETCPFFSMNHALGTETNDLASPRGCARVGAPETVIEGAVAA